MRAPDEVGRIRILKNHRADVIRQDQEPNPTWVQAKKRFKMWYLNIYKVRIVQTETEGARDARAIWQQHLVTAQHFTGAYFGDR